MPDNALVLGRGKHGKSSLSESVALECVVQDLVPLVCDPIGIEHHWPGCEVTKDVHEYLRIFWRSRDRPCFLEEYALLCREKGVEAQLLLTATTGRNQIGARGLGNWTHFSCHRLFQLDVTLRDQCSELYLFACRADDAYQLSLDYNRPNLRFATNLNPLEYMHTAPGEPVTLWEIDPVNLETRRISRKLSTEAA